jgi:hypothetical protein
MKARSITKLAAMLCGVALTALAMAAPAHAGEWKGTDPAHDVAAKVCEPTCDYQDAPRNASADMVSQQVVYRHDSVHITVRLRHVDRSASFALTNLVATTDREGRYFAAISAFSPTRPAQVSLKNPSGIALKCGAATTELRGNTIQTVIPARCLNSPEWVRWSGYMRVIFPGDLDNDRRFAGWFDKFRTGSDTPLNKNTFEFSRRILRAA